MKFREVLRKNAPTIKRVCVLGILALVARGCYSCAFPLPTRLRDQIVPGMSAGEIRIRATKLGFAWRVREETLMVDAEPTLKRDGAGHIICHLAGNEWVCENFADATSFGMAFESHACNIIVKNGVVDHAWLYMD